MYKVQSIGGGGDGVLVILRYKVLVYKVQSTGGAGGDCVLVYLGTGVCKVQSVGVQNTGGGGVCKIQSIGLQNTKYWWWWWWW